MSTSRNGVARSIAMIPARMGSTRLPVKNLALLGGKPLIAYAIGAARESGVFDRVIVNCEDPRMEVIARRYGAEFYRRPKRLATSRTASDLVVVDFLHAHACELLAWVNPIAPLQTGEEIRGVVEHFQREGLDSLITVKREQVHCIYHNQAVNFRSTEPFARTQDLEPVLACVYSVMMWRSATFLRRFEQAGHALLGGKLGYYPVSRASSIIIKRAEDLAVAEALLRTRARSTWPVRYDPLVSRIKPRVAVRT